MNYKLLLMKKRSFLIFTLLVFACNRQQPKQENAIQTEERWRGLLHLNDSTNLPFIFSISKQNEQTVINLINGNDTVVMNRVATSGDSIYAEVPVFNAALSFVMLDPEHLRGAWHYYDKAADFSVPFSAIKTEANRFSAQHAPCCPLEAPWAFTIGDRPAPHALSDFRNSKEKFWGSILTNTGDYRFMEGVVADSNFYFATFDGVFAYLFEGKFVSENRLVGTFFSSSTTVKPFTAVLDSNFQLANSDTLTYLKDANQPFEFTFLDLNGQHKTYNQASFQNKVTIVQILGTWCPNCLDETHFLKALLKDYQSKGLQVVGLAFERKPELEASKKAIEKMQRDLEVPYEILFAGKAGAQEAAAALPMLNAVLSYPTAIFVGPDGRVRKIETGFNGPGTSKYDQYVKDTHAFIEELLTEIQ